MNSDTRFRPGFLIGCVTAAVAAATVGVFVTFAPGHSSPTYWGSMLDFLLIEASTGFLYVRQFVSSTNRGRSGPSPAMQAGMASTAVLLGVVGAAVDLSFLFHVFGPSHDGIALWVMVGRWLLLLALLVPMALSDQSHREGHAELVLVQQERQAMIASVEAGLRALRRIQTSDADRAALHRLADDVDAVRNRMRGWASGSLHTDPTRVGQLVEALAAQVDALDSASAENRAAEIVRVQTITRQVAKELSGLTSALLN